MASLISNRESDPDSLLESNRKKRRKVDPETESSATVPAQVKWRSPSEQRIYTVKLIQALQRAREGTSPVREVRDAANRVLATAAKGRTRWSRAILTSRLNRIRRNHKKVKAPTGCARLRKPPPAAIESRKRKRLPPVEKRMEILSRLVPGCRGIPVANLLEEAGDYIAALEMQVRAMTALTELLTGAQTQSDRLGSTSSS